MCRTAPALLRTALNLLCALLTTSLHASASGQTLLKYGAWFEGCIETCTAGPNGGTLQQCRSFCGCMVDDINEQGIAAEYLPFARKPSGFAERNLQMQKRCAANVLARSAGTPVKPLDPPTAADGSSATRGENGHRKGSSTPAPEQRLVEPSLRAQEIKKWWAFSWGKPNPGGKFEAALGDAKVLLCHYHSPSNNSPITRIAWYDAPPATSNELRRLNGPHPIGQLGSLRLDKCPQRISEFDTAKKQAG